MVAWYKEGKEACFIPISRKWLGAEQQIYKRKKSLVDPMVESLKTSFPHLLVSYWASAQLRQVNEWLLLGE